MSDKNVEALKLAESLPEDPFYAARMAGRAYVRAFIDPDATFNESDERGYVDVIIRTYLAALNLEPASLSSKISTS